MTPMTKKNSVKYIRGVISRYFQSLAIIPVSSMTRSSPPRITYGTVARMKFRSNENPLSAR